ncbi:MAG: zinc ribbon domain-containing protein [Planctomycetota bacterium]
MTWRQLTIARALTRLLLALSLLAAWLLPSGGAMVPAEGPVRERYQLGILTWIEVTKLTPQPYGTSPSTSTLQVVWPHVLSLGVLSLLLAVAYWLVAKWLTAQLNPQLCNKCGYQNDNDNIQCAECGTSRVEKPSSEAGRVY